MYSYTFVHSVISLLFVTFYHLLNPFDEYLMPFGKYTCVVY